MKTSFFSVYILIVISVFSCGVLAVNAETMPIKDLSAADVGKNVTVEGRIVNVIQPFDHTAPYIVYLTDNVEAIQVIIWIDTFDKIKDYQKIQPFAEIRAKGEVKMYRNSLNVTVNKPSDVKIVSEAKKDPQSLLSDYHDEAIEKVEQSKKAAPAPKLPEGVLRPSEIKRSMLDDKVTVQGAVREYKPSWNERAPNSIFLTDDTGASLQVVYWQEVKDVLGSENKPAPGQIFRITGEVDEFRNDIQLRVRDADDISIIKAGKQKVAMDSPDKESREGEGTPDDPVTVTPSNISGRLLGKYVKVKGKVVDIRPSWKETAPTTVQITDGEENLDFVYWPDTGRNMEQEPVRSMELEITGELKEFRGKLQVNLNSADEYKVISVPGKGAVEKEAVATNIGDIGRKQINQMVKISGKITDAVKIGGGRLLKVTDDTGTITVPFWDSEMKESPSYDDVQEGAEITLIGLVNVYEPSDEIQVKITDPKYIKSVRSPDK